MAGLCKYSEALGVPGEGFHSHGSVGFAYKDVLATIALITGIWAWKRWNVWLIVAIVLITTIAVHYVFCVPTRLNALLGLAD